LLSAVIVAFDRAALVDKCLESLALQTERRFEAIVVLNGATAAVERVVVDCANADPRVRIVRSGPTTASEARNAGIEIANGGLIYFLDDDVEVPPDGFAVALRVFAEHPDVAIAGGPNLTPPDDPGFAQMCGEVLASRFGTGITHYRYAIGREGKASERNLTLCNLVVARRLFEQGERFPKPFGGEENVLMGRAMHLGHRLWYSPSLWVYHRRRSRPREHVAQASRYGFGRGIALHTGPRTFHVAFFAPVLLLGVVLCTPLALLRYGPLAVVPLAVYGLLACVASCFIAFRTKQWRFVVFLPSLFFVTHLAYAVGLLRGLRWGLDHRRGPGLGPSDGDTSALDKTRRKQPF
jgi:GT2 family glycosyltransferase